MHREGKTCVVKSVNYTFNPFPDFETKFPDFEILYIFVTVLLRQ